MTYSLKERHYQSSGAIPIRGKTEVTNRETKRLNANPFTLSSHSSLVSSSEGKIASVLLTIPNYAAKRFSNTYNQIFGKLPFDTAFVVAVHDATRNEVESWIASHGIEDRSTIVPLPNFLNFSVWAEDAYVTIFDGAQNTPVLVEPFEFPRYADSLVADYVSSNTTILGSTTPLYFQGGNILIGDDFFLIGSDYPRRTLDYVGKQILPEEGETSAELVRRLYKEFLDHKRAIHYVGTARTLPSEERVFIEVEGETWSEIRFYGNAEGTKQPIFHIDMFISPAGRSENGDFQLLVGDPAAAARLIDMPLPDHAMQSSFDEIAEQLVGLGFEVIRNPLPLIYMDDPFRRTRLWYFATSNNALVQNGPGIESRVWLPEYGFGNWRVLSKTDEANAQIWRRLGYDVSRMGDFHSFAERRGSLHCITKFLQRS